MINITKKENCCGCTACASICPKAAIKLVQDEEGFSYPNVDKSKCVECGMCEKVCPFMSEGERNKPKKIYAAKHRDKKILLKSTSGGVFTALSDYVLDNGGVVYGAIFNDEFEVVHGRATNKKERDKMRGSKYVQSDITGIYSCVKEDLKSGKIVLFTGTPCQADGLKRYLNGKFEKLIICDLICFGVPSPRIWRSYVDFISTINKSKLKEHYFRSYEKTWFEHIALSVFENGKKYQDKGYSNIFTQIYYSKLANRPSCHKCPYTAVSRVSDITIGDCRGIDKVIPTLECDDGVSLVFVNTSYGENLYERVLNNLDSIEIELDTVMQPPLRSPAKANKKREAFFEVYSQKGFKKTLDWYFGKFYVIKQFVKKIIKK